MAVTSGLTIRNYKFKILEQNSNKYAIARIYQTIIRHQVNIITVFSTIYVAMQYAREDMLSCHLSNWPEFM